MANYDAELARGVQRFSGSQRMSLSDISVTDCRPLALKLLDQGTLRAEATFSL